MPRGSNFLLLRQKKVTKEKATPTFALIRDLKRKRRAVRNSLRSNNGPLHRRFRSKSRGRMDGDPSNRCLIAARYGLRERGSRHPGGHVRPIWQTIQLRLSDMNSIVFLIIGFVFVLEGVAAGVVVAWQVLRWTHSTATYRASNLYLNAFSYSDLSPVAPTTYEHFQYVDVTGKPHSFSAIGGNVRCQNGDTVAILYNPNKSHIAVRASSLRVRGMLSSAIVIVGVVFFIAAFASR